MPELISTPTKIPVPGGKLIEEHVGAVTTPDANLQASVSVAHMQAPAGWSEPYQTPDFDEITVPFPERGDPALAKAEREPEPAAAS